MKRYITIVLTLFLLVLSVFTITSCNNNNGGNNTNPPVECTHEDKNDDELCDKCGVAFKDGIDVCTHKDADDNAKCDICGADFEDGKDLPDDPGFVDTISLEELYAMIDAVIPSEVTSDVRLPRGFDESLAFLYWYSSNEEAITNGGKVTRGYEDVPVSFRVVIEYSETETYERVVNTVVKGFHLKPLENKKLVVAYLYASAGFSGISEESLEYVDYINYSFGGVTDGKAVVSDTAQLRKVLSYRDYGVRVGLALGGWGSGDFSNAVRTKEARTKFADSIIELMKKYNFDGIDIDWEYPGSSVAGIPSHYTDTANLTLFCQELYAKIKAYRPDALLTMAVAASTAFDFKNLSNCVDYFNLMTYDHSIGDSNAYHHASLYSNSYAHTSVNSAVTKLINWGVPSNKIVIGAAFYGRTAPFASKNDAKLGGKLTTTLSKTYSYTQIEEGIKNGTYIEMYDEVACANYIITTGANTAGRFITYDGVESVTAKCNYVYEKELGGIMFWDYTQDKNGTLIIAINNAFEKQKD